MNETSETYNQPTLRDTPKSTSWPASGAGRMPSSSQDGLQLSLFGLPAYPASPSAQPDMGEAPMMSDTSGPPSPNSSHPADLLSSLESKLRAKLEDRGSMEYRLTWKTWTTPAGRSISRLARSGHPTLETGSTGSPWTTPTQDDVSNRTKPYAQGGYPLSLQARGTWPTPNATDSTGAGGWQNREGGMNLQSAAQTVGTWPTPETTNAGDGEPFQKLQQSLAERRARTRIAVAEGRVLAGSGRSMNLAMTVQATVGTWPTPNAADAWTPQHTTENTLRRGDPNGTLRSTSGSLAKDVAMKVHPQGWGTPMVRDWREGPTEGTAPVNGLLSRQVWGLGETPSGSSAPTVKPDASPTLKLNPAFTRWLMGYPASWDEAAPKS